MQLCIDIGNSRAKCAIFDGDKLVDYYREADLSFEVLEQWKKQYYVNHSILSTTRNLDKSTYDHLKSITSTLLILDHETPIPIKNGYESPISLGRDRLAAAVASQALFPNEPVIFVDCGTCLTYNFVDRSGTYLGGNISPGITMRLQAMNHFTDKLPLVEAAYNDDVFGKNTVKAMQNGAVRAAILEISAFIDSVNKIYGETKVIITGGDSIIFAKHLNFKIFAHPNLVLFGLNKILLFNLKLSGSNIIQ
jgi:type III pantothenate kinase